MGPEPAQLARIRLLLGELDRGLVVRRDALQEQTPHLIAFEAAHSLLQQMVRRGQDARRAGIGMGTQDTVTDQARPKRV